MQLIYSTFPNAVEAFSASRQLLEKRLIACANILPGVESLYWWEGKITSTTEAVLIAKTSDALASLAIESLNALHPHAFPCVVRLAIAEAAPQFKAWLEQETSEKPAHW